MTKKLLTKTTQSFLLVAVIILMIAAPLFYYMSRWLYIYEADEILQFHKTTFVNSELSQLTKADIANWNRYNLDTKILPYTGLKKDTVFSVYYLDPSSKEKEPYRELWTTIQIDGKKYTYIEKQNMVEMEDMAYSVVALFLSVILLLLLGIIIFSNLLSKKIWSPFYATLSQIHSFEIDKNNKPNFAQTNIEEFNSLNNSLDKLIDKNTQIYRSQREFIENAAHELQTPLALFQAKIDTLAQSEGLSEQQSELIGTLNNDITRLNRLNKNLLLLSKIDNDSYVEKQQFIINDYLDKHIDFFRQQASSKSISINTLPTKQVSVYVNATLAEVLLNNLFMNALRHNVNNGNITISLTGQSITFSNSGLVPLNTGRLFNRFCKSDGSSQGNGLGLAIVKKIADINNWKVSYVFSGNMHQFIVAF